MEKTRAPLDALFELRQNRGPRPPDDPAETGLLGYHMVLLDAG
jgi:hypothetical protein